jgi:DnaA-homolog protein
VSGTAPGADGPAARRSGAAQLPLAFRCPPDQRLEAYLRAPAGAIGLLRALARGEAGDWPYLAGVSGTGKTHLALAACAEAQAAGRSAAYLPLAAAAGRVREALQAREAQQLLALDGVEALAGRSDDELALFEFHNRARAAGVAVLYTAAAAPDALPLALPDLRSRLAQCTRIVLAPLDDEGRRDVLRDRARRRGLVLEPGALDWLLRHRGRDLAGLTAALDRLDRASLAAQRRVTLPFLREVLEDGGVRP